MVAATKLELIMAGLILVGGGYFYHTWLTEHDARIRAESDVAAQQQKISSIQEDDKKQQVQTLAQVQAIAEAAAKHETPQLAARYLPSQLPVPQPISITLPPPTKDNPQPPAIASIPQPDLPVLNNLVASCKVCSLELTSANTTIADQKKELADAQNQVKDLQRELKGGTLWQRFRHDAKIVGISLGVGALAVLAAKK